MYTVSVSSMTEIARSLRALFTDPLITRIPDASGLPAVMEPVTPFGISRNGCLAHLYSMQREGRSPTGQSPSEKTVFRPFAQTESSGTRTWLSINAETSSLNHAAASLPPFNLRGAKDFTVFPARFFHAKDTVMSPESKLPSGMLRTSTSRGSPAISSLR